MVTSGRSSTATQVGLALMLAQTAAADGAEVNVLAGAAFSPALAELGPQFERATGHKLLIQYVIAGTLRQHLEAAEAFDLLIIPAGLLDEAARQGKVAAGTRIVIARVGMGVAVRTGAPKPDISSVDAFKRMLLDASSVTYPPEGTIGIHLTKVFDRLDIAEQMKPKIKPQETVDHVPPAVAAGEAEFGFAPSTVLLSGAGVEFVGPFPSELQTYLVYATGIGAATKRPDAAKALITHLTMPNAIALMEAKGFEPRGP